MRNRLMKLGVMIGALAAMAVGGSAIATAAQKGSPATPPIVAPAVPDTATAADGDTLQQGDQAGPETADSAKEAAGETAAESAPDSAAEIAADAAGESASESGPSDGPGGHADPAGAVDNQQEGSN